MFSKMMAVSLVCLGLSACGEEVKNCAFNAQNVPGLSGELICGEYRSGQIEQGKQKCAAAEQKFSDGECANHKADAKPDCVVDSKQLLALLPPGDYYGLASGECDVLKGIKVPFCPPGVVDCGFSEILGK